MAVARIPRAVTDPLERELAQAYAEAWAYLKQELAVIRQRVAAARTAGTPITRSWLRQQQLLDGLLAQVEARLRVIGFDTVGRLERRRWFSLDRGRLEAERRLRGIGIATPRSAQDVFERVAVDQRLLDYFTQRDGAMTASRVRQTLANGIVRGRNPRVVARDVRTALGSSLSRARTIARTEMLNAYRRAAIDTYRANRDVVAEWEWLAEADACPVCEELNGQRFPVEQDFDTHPNCRCTCVPVTAEEG